VIIGPEQKRLLDALRRRIQRDGSAPSLRRAVGDLGISHVAAAQRAADPGRQGLPAPGGR